MLARLGRADPNLLSTITHRSEAGKRRFYAQPHRLRSPPLSISTVSILPFVAKIHPFTASALTDPPRPRFSRTFTPSKTLATSLPTSITPIFQ